MSSSSQTQKILVIGVGRSGTTAIYSLLQRMLDHSAPGQTDYVYEPFLWDRKTFNRPITDVTNQFQSISSLSVDGIYHHKSLPMFCNELADVSAETRDWLFGLGEPANGKQHSLIKMIRGNGRLEVLKQMMPDVKIVSLFRNPLEVINSSINMFSFFGDDFYDSDYPRFTSEAAVPVSDRLVEREFSYWLAMNQHMAQQVAADKECILPVLHEEYVSNREGTVRRICDHLDLPFDPAFVEFASENVGPVNNSQSQLTAQEYLFLESQLGQYESMVSEMATFDLRDTLLATREKFIVGDFFKRSEVPVNFQTSHYLRRQQENRDRRIANLEKRLSDSSAALESMKDNPLDLIQRGSIPVSSHELINQKDAKIKSLESEAMRKHDQIENLQGVVSETGSRLVQLEQDLAAGRIELEKWQQQLKSSQASNLQHESTIDELEKRVDDQQQMLQEKTKAINKLEEDLATEHAMRIEAGRVVSAQDTDILAKSQELAQSQQKLQVLSSELDREKSSVEKFIAKLDDRETEIASMKKLVGDLHDEINNLTSDLDRFAADKNNAESRMQQVYNQLQERERSLGENVQNQNLLFDTFKQDLAVQHQKLGQYENILGQLRKITGYPLTQLDRKLRAYRKLVRLYDRVKPEWHENKLPKYNRRHYKKTRKRVRRHRIDLGNQVQAFYGNHRSGWAYAVAALNTIHNPEGIYVDTFIERTFCWNPEGVKAHTKPWVGFVHVPPFVPPWFQYEQSNQAIFQSEAWLESQPHCRGLFTLSKYHRDFLQPRFDFPVENLVHPTEIPETLWSWEAFQANREKRIVQLGWWLRKLHAIYQLPTSQYQKTLIKVTEQDYLQKLFSKEKEQLTAIGEFNDSMYESVDVIKFLPNDQYDNLLSANIVFLQLYDSSANNSVIECIARGTPLLVNRIAPVVEYLGPDYPFYYDSLDEAVAKASDFELVRETHKFLLNCETRKKLTGEHFVHTLLESDIILDAYQDFKPAIQAA